MGGVSRLSNNGISPVVNNKTNTGADRVLLVDIIMKGKF